MISDQTSAILQLVKERIASKTVEPPKKMNSSDMVNWLVGYTAAQNADCKIIDELLEEHSK